MSAPRTNVPEQTRRHLPSLIGIALAVLFGVGVVGWWVLDTTSGETPEAAPGGTQIAPEGVPPPSQPDPAPPLRQDATPPLPDPTPPLQ